MQCARSGRRGAASSAEEWKSRARPLPSESIKCTRPGQTVCCCINLSRDQEPCDLDLRQEELAESFIENVVDAQVSGAALSEAVSHNWWIVAGNANACRAESIAGTGPAGSLFPHESSGKPGPPGFSMH